MKPRFYLFAILLAIASCNCLHAQRPQRPNIIFILGDDIGYDLLAVNGGQSYVTPNLDFMARHGMNFTHCESSPLCNPSRAMLLTGKHNFRNYHTWGYLVDTAKTMGNLMRDAGYNTAFMGKLQLPLFNNPEQMQNWGWNKYTIFEVQDDTLDEHRYKSPTLIDNNGKVPENITKGKYCDDILTQRIGDFIDSNKTNPFFIYYSMSLAHKPFCPTPDDPQYAGWNPSSNASDTAHYPSMIKYMDKKIGEILNKLKTSGLDKNTIVFFAGDNGTPADIFYYSNGKKVRGGKSFTIEGGTHVPLIAYMPNHIAPNSTNDDLIDFTDFFPTFADLAQYKSLNKYAPLDGTSIYNRLFPKADTIVRDTIYTDTTIIKTVNIDTTIIDSINIDTTIITTVNIDTTILRTIRTDTTIIQLVTIDTTIVDTTTNVSRDTTLIDTIRVDTTFIDTIRVDTTIINTIRIDTTFMDTIRIDTTLIDSVRVDSSIISSIKVDTLRFVDSLRSFIFSHYAPYTVNNKDTVRRWVRNKEYKLYDSTGVAIDGKFYNILKDPNEKTAIPTAKLTPAEKALQTTFRNVLKATSKFPPAPLLQNITVTGITSRAATLSANITTTGATDLIERGTNIRTGEDAFYFNNNKRDSVIALGNFSQTRILLNPQAQYYFSVYGRNRNTSHSIGYYWGKFYTISNPPIKAATALTATADACSIKLTWKAATFPTSGATKAGYLIYYSTNTISLNSAANGKSPAFVTTKPQTRMVNLSTKLPSKPAATVTINGLSPDTLYYFKLVPYTYNGTNDSTYNYRTDSAAATKGKPLSCTSRLLLTINEEEMNSPAIIAIAPNPSKSSFTLKLNSTLANELTYIQVSDAIGRIYYKTQISGRSDFTFGQELKPGVYFIYFNALNQQYQYKIIKE